MNRLQLSCGRLATEGPQERGKTGLCPEENNANVGDKRRGERETCAYRWERPKKQCDNAAGQQGRGAIVLDIKPEEKSSKKLHAHEVGPRGKRIGLERQPKRAYDSTVAGRRCIRMEQLQDWAVHCLPISSSPSSLYSCAMNDSSSSSLDSSSFRAEDAPPPARRLSLALFLICKSLLEVFPGNTRIA